MAVSVELTAQSRPTSSPKIEKLSIAKTLRSKNRTMISSCRVSTEETSLVQNDGLFDGFLDFLASMFNILAGTIKRVGTGAHADSSYGEEGESQKAGGRGQCHGVYPFWSVVINTGYK